MTPPLQKSLPLLSRFQQPHTWRAYLEVISAIGFFCAGVFLCASPTAFGISQYIIVCIGVLLISAGQIKLFTIQHDCGHHSLVNSKVANKWIGRGCSLFTFIPFDAWRIEHNQHHKHFCDASQQTLGDIYLMTEEQFVSGNSSIRIGYRILRSRLFILLVAPLVYILLRSRVPIRANKRQRLSIHLTSLCLLLFYAIFFFVLPNLMIPLILALYISGLIGMIIFHNEHQFKEAHWTTGENWSFYDACVHGSSVIELPTFFSWLTGHIGYHNIHHLAPRIPSYRIRQAFIATKNEIPNHSLRFSQLLFPVGFLVWSTKSGRLVKQLSLFDLNP